MNTQARTRELVASGMRQFEIAKKSGLAQATVSRILAGYDVSKSTASKITELYYREFPAREITALRKHLAVANGNFDFAQDYIKVLQSELASAKEQTCLWCRAKLYIRNLWAGE